MGYLRGHRCFMSECPKTSSLLLGVYSSEHITTPVRRPAALITAVGSGDYGAPWSPRDGYCPTVGSHQALEFRPVGRSNNDPTATPSGRTARTAKTARSRAEGSTRSTTAPGARSSTTRSTTPAATGWTSTAAPTSPSRATRSASRATAGTAPATSAAARRPLPCST